ncbi:MAG TPA: hypothetical protein VJ851_10675 [Jatrophihabitans sp.]|nr:hypothetical protein [Jatrophihabitans sp.]
MRTISSVNLQRDYDARSAAIVAHLRIQGDRLDGDELRKLYNEIPVPVRKAKGSLVAGPDHEAIADVLHEAGYEDRTSLYSQGADALSLICQATEDQLKIDKLVGAFSLGVNNLFDVNGLISHGPNGTLQIRLRAAPQHLYRATDRLLKEIARVDRHVNAEDLSSISKERGQDDIAETAEIRLLRRRGNFSVLREATRQRIVDPGVWWLLGLAVFGGVISWLDHFHPGLLMMRHWNETDITWFDGWVGRLASAALFGAVSALGVLAATIRRVFGEEDGIYMTVAWDRN